MIRTGTLVPMATTTSPMVNLSTDRIHPDLPTRVTIAKLRIAIHTIDMKKDTIKYFRLCGLEQSGIVHVNMQMNGKLTMNNSQPRRYFIVFNKLFFPSGYWGISAETGFKHGKTLIVGSSSSTLMALLSAFLYAEDSGGECCPLPGGRKFPFASTSTIVTVCGWGGGDLPNSDRNNSDRRRISFFTCPCAMDFILI